jgi:hypothetical protein
MANWSENFDGYADGTKLYHIGGWSGWDDVEACAGTVTSAQALSIPHSVVVSNSMGVDCVHPFSGYDSGYWVFTAWQYVPSDLDAMTYFIINNEYNHGGPYDWAVETHMDPATGMVNEINHDPDGNNAVPIVYDRWVEIVTLIDLDNNYMEHYYGGQMIASGQWNIRTGGLIEIQNVDLYGPHEVGVYYDNLSLVVPEPGFISLLGLGVLALLRKRR